MEKLKIVREVSLGQYDEEKPFEVSFNPNQMSFDRGVTWSQANVPNRDTADTSFTHGEPIRLSMDLFFDSFERGEDVRLLTRPVMELSRVQGGDLGRPPRFKLIWGKYDFEGILWVVTHITQRFNLFHASGFPARATLTCSFLQWRSKKEEDQESPRSGGNQDRTHTVARGESLSDIAAAEYGDPAAWRPIAETNGIDNPRQVEPGRVLTIPPRQPGRSLRS